MFNIEKFNHFFFESLHRDLDEHIVSMSRYHFRSPGSYMRAELAFNFAHAYNTHEETALNIAIIVECLHNASLIHDDIQDGAMIRRKQPTLSLRFGKQNALSFGDYLISFGYYTCSHLPNAHVRQCLELIHHYVKRTISGQIQDINAMGKIGLTFQHYEEISWLKSGQLIMICTQLPALLANKVPHDDAFIKIIKPLMISFQILDDLIDEHEDSDQNNFSILNILENDKPVDVNKAFELAKIQLQESKQALELLPENLRWPLNNLLERLNHKLQMEQIV